MIRENFILPLISYFKLLLLAITFGALMINVDEPTDD